MQRILAEFELLEGEKPGEWEVRVQVFTPRPMRGEERDRAPTFRTLEFVRHIGDPGSIPAYGVCLLPLATALKLRKVFLALGDDAAAVVEWRGWTPPDSSLPELPATFLAGLSAAKLFLRKRRS